MERDKEIQGMAQGQSEGNNGTSGSAGHKAEAEPGRTDSSGFLIGLRTRRYANCMYCGETFDSSGLWNHLRAKHQDVAAAELRRVLTYALDNAILMPKSPTEWVSRHLDLSETLAAIAAVRGVRAENSLRDQVFDLALEIAEMELERLDQVLSAATCDAWEARVESMRERTRPPVGTPRPRPPKEDRG